MADRHARSAPLRREGIIMQSPSIGNWLRAAAPLTRRSDWAEPGKPIGPDAIAAVRRNSMSAGGPFPPATTVRSTSLKPGRDMLRRLSPTRKPVSGPPAGSRAIPRRDHLGLVYQLPSPSPMRTGLAGAADISVFRL